VTLVHDQFLRTAMEFEFAILAYCYMPDHLHLLAEGVGEASSLPASAALAKQRAAFVTRTMLPARLWQKGYFERVLRDEDDTFNVARYVTGSSILTKDQLIGSGMWRHP
jgi:putative transposase